MHLSGVFGSLNFNLLAVLWLFLQLRQLNKIHSIFWLLKELENLFCALKKVTMGKFIGFLACVITPSSKPFIFRSFKENAKRMQILVHTFY